MTLLYKIASIADGVNRYVGRILAWLTLFIVLMTVVSVIQRYIFSVVYVWEREIVMQVHAMIFMCIGGYTWLSDSHVRVDVLYERFKARTKTVINLAGSILLVIPVCFAIMYFSYGFVLSSWSILEGSREYGGMPTVFMVKGLILLLPFFILLHAVSIICSSVIELFDIN